MPLGDLPAKWRAFGWEVEEIDGHSMAQIYDTLYRCKEERKGLPKVVLAHTVKGRGISFMENDISWHAKPVSDEQLALALDELGWTGGGLND
jgi:transketolase